MRAARFGVSVVAVAAVVGLCRLAPRVNNTTVALSLLMVILAISARWGLAEATVAAVAAVLGFNFFFLPPIGTLTINDPQNLVAFLAFLATAITASQLAERARRRTAESEERRLEIERLYNLVQGMMLGGTPAKTIHEFVHRVVQVFGCDGAAFYYQPKNEMVRSGPATKPVSDHELIALAEVDGATIDTARGIATSPVRFAGRTLGSMALVGAVPSAQTVRAIVNLVAITIEKARALEDASHAEAARHNEQLRAALLDSLAHDIKTPLTSIKAAVTSLLGAGGGPGDRELLTIINEEADRLNRIAAEVIEMARIDAGKLHLEKRPVEAHELIAAALHQFAAPLKSRSVYLKVAEDLPEAEADPDLAGQVVKQLIENGLKYSPDGSPLTISAQSQGGKIVIGVADRGPGIEDNERLRIFDKFYRGRQHRFATQGTGMGLAIARGIVEAHGEKIWVDSEPGQGSAFYFSLPVRGGARTT
jgi:two-component system sensor histidine kinase KdpD